jgi:hypothetical protein
MRAASRLPNEKLSPEFRLAVATSVWPAGRERAERMEAALACPIHWELFLRVVQRHRIAGLSFQALTAASAPVPEAASRALQAAAERQTGKSLLYAAETVRVSRLLRDAGIPVASLKGAPLSVLAFNDIALRHCRDMDLLVLPEYALHADEVLAAAGYHLQMPIGPHTLRQKKHWIGYRKHFEYQGRQGIPLELHWRFFDNPRLCNLSIEPSSWREVQILGNTSLQTLSAPDLLLYLCIHGANHMWFRLKWLADVQALLRQSGPQTVPRLLADAHNRRCERAVAQTLALTHILYGLPAPELVPPMDAATSALVGSAISAMTAGQAASELEAVPFATSRMAMARFLLRRDWRFRLREAGSVLADERDRKSARLPHSMRFFLPFLRLPLWLSRRLRGRGRSHRGRSEL